MDGRTNPLYQIWRIPSLVQFLLQPHDGGMSLAALERSRVWHFKGTLNPHILKPGAAGCVCVCACESKLHPTSALSAEL